MVAKQTINKQQQNYQLRMDSSRSHWVCLCVCVWGGGVNCFTSQVFTLNYADVKPQN